MRIDLFKGGEVGSEIPFLSMEEAEPVKAGVLEGVRHYLPGYAGEVQLDRVFFSFDLPAVPGADYRFAIHIRPHGERQISARLHGGEQGYFWYLAFEEADYPGNQQQLERWFWRVLHYLLTCETRITQSKGILFWKFRCEALIKGKWRVISSMFGLRGQCVPAHKDRRRVFTSPPLVPQMAENPGLRTA